MNLRKAAYCLGLAASATFLLACNSHPVSVSTVAGVVERQEQTNIEGTASLDILWVIDNSGSMCQEQEVLRNGFEDFIGQIEETNLDFHIGVTTTHVFPVSPLETVAKPGLLQSTPQPLPGFDESCWERSDEDGQRVTGDFEPIFDALDQAIACMENPTPSAFNWTSNDIACALRDLGYEGSSEGCEIAGAGCGGAGTACGLEDIFPDPSTFKTIPKVLRSADYRDANGNLDVDTLRDDFACMSFVGTRGDGFEAGLIAAVEAVSPENTGGSIENPDDVGAAAPNHGLIRSDARFAMIFVTDENDCSNPLFRNTERSQQLYRDPNRPEINRGSACGAEICEVTNAEGYPNSPLIPVEELKQQFLENLAETKGRSLGEDFTEGEVLVASIHGDARRFPEVITEDDCSGDDWSGVNPTCASSLGIAFSGDRYQRFLRLFPEENFYPEEGANTQGWMCQGDFTPALEAIGEFLIRDTAGCVTRPILPCSGEMDTSCPAVPYSGDAGRCTLVPNTGGMSVDGEMVEARYYCDSGIQLRAQVRDSNVDSAEALRSTGYCIEESINDRSFPDGCVIDPNRYNWLPCPSGLAGLKLDWVDGVQDATRALGGVSLQIRYNSVSSEDVLQPE